MANINVLNQNGEVVSNVELNDSVWAIEPNQQAMFDAVMVYRNSTRQATAKTKTRSEVRGGGKKPWRQKGTGRARQGSIRAPQWRGGGIVFGPNTNRNYKIKLNRKVRQLALKSALSQKVIDSELTVLDNLALTAPKTKDMVKILANLDANRKTLIVMDEVCENVALSARNIPGVFLTPVNNASVYEILCYDKLVVTEGAVKYYEEELN